MNFWTDFHENICKTLQQNIPAIQTCMAYPLLRKTIAAPAILLEVNSFELGQDVGTEQLTLQVHVEARIVVDAVLTDAHIQIRHLVTEVMRVVHLNTWDLPVSPAHLMAAHIDAFKPELDAYLVWNVNWIHDVQLGQSIWEGGITPHMITVGEKVTS